MATLNKEEIALQKELFLKESIFIQQGRFILTRMDKLNFIVQEVRKSKEEDKPDRVVTFAYHSTLSSALLCMVKNIKGVEYKDLPKNIFEEFSSIKPLQGTKEYEKVASKALVKYLKEN